MNVARRWQVYAIFSPVHGRPIYVGRTYGDVVGRVTQHYRKASKRLQSLLRGWTLKGLAPRIEVLEKGFGDGSEAERRWIVTLRSWGYRLINVTPGGEGKALLPGATDCIACTGSGDGIAVRRIFEYAAAWSKGNGFRQARSRRG